MIGSEDLRKTLFIMNFMDFPCYELWGSLFKRLMSPGVYSARASEEIRLLMHAVCVTNMGDPVKIERDLASPFLAPARIQARICKDHARQNLHEERRKS